MCAFVGVLSMVYAFMVLLLYRLCGGLQGFTEISVQSTTWEPDVEGYVAMGKFPA